MEFTVAEISIKQLNPKLRGKTGNTSALEMR